MNNKKLKDKMDKSIAYLESTIIEMDNAIEEISTEITDKQYILLKDVLSDIQSAYGNVEDNFSDFESEVDDVHSILSQLLGKVGN